VPVIFYQYSGFQISITVAYSNPYCYLINIASTRNLLSIDCFITTCCMASSIGLYKVAVCLKYGHTPMIIYTKTRYRSNPFLKAFALVTYSPLRIFQDSSNSFPQVKVTLKGLPKLRKTFTIYRSNCLIKCRCV